MIKQYVEVEKTLVKRNQYKSSRKKFTGSDLQDSLPLSFVENERFAEFMSVVEPGYDIPVTSTILS